ncbi:MAG: hypothetical protein QM752_07940 [Gammaproteobacteria bacterium]
MSSESKARPFDAKKTLQTFIRMLKDTTRPKDYAYKWLKNLGPTKAKKVLSVELDGSNESFLLKHVKTYPLQQIKLLFKDFLSNYFKICTNQELGKILQYALINSGKAGEDVECSEKFKWFIEECLRLRDFGGQTLCAIIPKYICFEELKFMGDVPRQAAINAIFYATWYFDELDIKECLERAAMACYPPEPIHSAIPSNLTLPGDIKETVFSSTPLPVSIHSLEQERILLAKAQQESAQLLEIAQVQKNIFLLEIFKQSFLTSPLSSGMFTPLFTSPFGPRMPMPTLTPPVIPPQNTQTYPLPFFTPPRPFTPLPLPPAIPLTPTTRISTDTKETKKRKATIPEVINKHFKP